MKTLVYFPVVNGVYDPDGTRFYNEREIMGYLHKKQIHDYVVCDSFSWQLFETVHVSY